MPNFSLRAFAPRRIDNEPAGTGTWPLSRPYPQRSRSIGADRFSALGGTGFNDGPGFTGLFAHYENEWVFLVNLFLLLVGFALLARHFEASRALTGCPTALPDNWTGGLVLLVLVFVISSFLDNIARGSNRLDCCPACVQRLDSPALARFPCFTRMSRLCVRCSSRASRHRLPNTNTPRIVKGPPSGLQISIQACRRGHHYTSLSVGTGVVVLNHRDLGVHEMIFTMTRPESFFTRGVRGASIAFTDGRSACLLS